MEVNETKDPCKVNSSTDSDALVDGYDLPVYGLCNGQFLLIHVPALTCIQFSLVSAVTVIVTSFILNKSRSFWKWTKSERFVVYLALCDGLFNVAHTMDHAHIVALRNHVRPRALCEFYGFMLAEFITSQNLMVNIVAINAFLLIFYGRDLNFGKYDWRLLAYTFGTPFVGATIAGIGGQLGPNGTFCYFDGVKGQIANIMMTTVPLLFVLLVNTVLYILTWQRIHTQAKQLRASLGEKAAASHAPHKAAKAMSLFVAAFFVQWWAMGTYGTWGLVVKEPPQLLFQFVTTFSNLGGVLNLIVFIIIRRRMLVSIRDRSRTEKSDKSAEHSGSRAHSNTNIRKARSKETLNSELGDRSPRHSAVVPNSFSLPANNSKANFLDPSTAYNTNNNYLETHV